jgi:hypothetical protein
MPQQFLHVPHVGAPVEEMRGEGMPQGVWVEPPDSDGFSMRQRAFADARHPQSSPIAPQRTSNDRVAAGLS